MRYSDEILDEVKSSNDIVDIIPVFGSSIGQSKLYNIMYEKYKNVEKNIKNILNYASCLFDLREYLKCSNILLEYNNPKFPQAMFLYNYCQYLIISQKMQEEKLENNENLNLKYSSCNNLNKLEIQISQHCENLSPFMNYLYGIILKDLNDLIKERLVLFLKKNIKKD